MAFSKADIEKLGKAEKDLQLVYYVANETIGKRIPFGISSTHRPPEEQYSLFKKGRILKDGKWEFKYPNRKGVVTYMDGYTKKSKHNYYPSKAVDIYLKDISDKYDHNVLAALNKELRGIATSLKKKGDISSNFRFGIKTPTFTDLPHGEVLSYSEVIQKRTIATLKYAVPIILIGAGIYLLLKK
jgi:hypothetical protein